MSDAISLNDTAARALERGDPLAALRCVALRDDAVALALRGIALAQLGELPRARELLQAALRAFGSRHALARARCHVAYAEIALAMRDLAFSERALQFAVRNLDAQGDTDNALRARLLLIRRLLLLGRVSEAEHALRDLKLANASSKHVAVASLIEADVALRGLHTQRARSALERARRAAERAGIAALIREVEVSAHRLDIPAARLIAAGHTRLVTLSEVERCLAVPQLVVDACARCVRRGTQRIDLRRRPVLFNLLRALAEAWPSNVPRETLITRVFEVTRVNESHRARLRVEIGRLRKKLSSVVDVRADKQGFLLLTRGKNAVLVLAPPTDDEAASLLALLEDGAAWSSSALALALGESQRSVQRALGVLEARGQVRALGRARSRRWLRCPTNDFATVLLLPTPHAID